jgi:hypothetical protein
LGDGNANVQQISSGANYGVLGTFYRFRTYNKLVDAKALYERADVDFADQYGSQTKLIDSDFNGSYDGWNSSNSWNSQTNPSNNLVLAASSINQACRTSTQLTAFKKYRVTYTASSVSGAPGFGYITTAGAFTNLGTITEGTGNTLEFYYDSNYTTKYFYIGAFSSDAAVTLDDISVVQIGAVVDMDLAFASPTQSLTVQDRAGLADGTASTSGVTQVQPVVQGNLTSLAVSSATARTPADGDIVADKVGVGRAPTQLLDVYQAGTAGNSYFEGGVKVGGASSSLGAFLGYNSSGSGIVNLTSLNNSGGTNAKLQLGFGAATDGSPDKKVITLDQNGKVTVTGTDTSAILSLYRDDATIGNNNVLGDINFGGADAPNEGGAIIRGISEAAWTSGSAPTGISFLTTPTNSVSASERLRIDRNGQTTITSSNQNVLFVNRQTSNGDVIVCEYGGVDRLRLGTEGITFPNGGTAPVAAAANQLDYYEEGTWTPVVVGGTMVISVTSSGKQARYTRIGNLVFVQCFCDITFAGDSTALQIEGLPFNAGSGDYAFIGVNASGTTVTNPYARVQSGNDHIDFFKNAQTGMPQSEFGSGNLIFSGCYNVA